MTGRTYEAPWNRRLTRYFSFARFVDFLSKGLFCAKATLFEDPWEGHVFHSITAAAENREALAAFVDRAKEWIYVSCWHASDSDSYAMWRIYGQSSEAVAVHTRIENLKNLMAHCPQGPNDPLAVLNVVRYTDPVAGELPQLDAETVYCTTYENPRNADRAKWRNLMVTCLGQKPTAYAYEEEVRLLFLEQGAPGYWDIADVKPQTAPGFHLVLDEPANFLERVSVAPDAPAWFLDVVRDTMARFGIDPNSIPVERSTLFEGPSRTRKGPR